MFNRESIMQRLKPAITANSQPVKPTSFLDRIKTGLQPGSIVKPALPTAGGGPMIVGKMSTNILAKVQELKAKAASGSLAPSQRLQVPQLEQQAVDLHKRELQASATTNPLLRTQMQHQVKEDATRLYSKVWDCATCNTGNTATSMAVNTMAPAAASSDFANTANTASTSTAPEVTADAVKAEVLRITQPQAKTAGGTGMLIFGALALGGLLLMGKKSSSKESLNGPTKQRSKKTYKTSI